MKIMDYYIEPYAKENNILQLSLFYFGKGKPQKSMVKWEDDKGEYTLSCVSKYGVPGSFEQDVYTACMRIWVKQGMKKNYIKINYSEIARELNLSPPKNWVSHIKKALKKLGQARYEFDKCFFKATEDGLTKVNTHFSLFDTATLFSHEKGQSKKQSESRLSFPDQIRDNLEANYYQYLDMVWYRTLSEGLPRRLYEYLEKRRYHSKNGYFTISEEILCRWLPITDTNPTRKKRRIKKIAGDLVEAGYLASYQYDKKRSMCTFQYAKKGPPPGMELNKERVPVQEQLWEDEQIPLNQGREVVSYEVAIEWIQGIKYFRTNYLKQIKELSRESVLETFPHARYMWDKGKIDKPGGVYKAFMESWRDQNLLVEREAQMDQEKQEKVQVTEEAYQVIHAKFLAPIEEEKVREEVQLELAARREREEAQAREEEEARRKQEERKMEVLSYIAEKGKENLTLLGGKILKIGSQGVVIEKGGDEQLIKYGNVVVGVNLK